MKSVSSKHWYDHVPEIFLFAAIVAAFLYALIGFATYPTDFPDEEENCNASDMVWSLVEEDGSMLPIQLSYYPKTGVGETSVITAVLPNDLEDKDVLALRPDQIDIVVKIAGVERLSYSTKDYRPFGKLSPRRLIFMELNKTDSGKTIEIEMTTYVANTGSISAPYYGDKYDVEHTLIRQSMGDVIIAGIMLVICILTLVVGIILSIGYKMTVEMNYLSIMGLLASVWILCNAEISQLYFKNNSITLSLDYMMLMLLPLPFLLYMNIIQKRKFQLVYRIFEYIAIADCFLCIILQVAGILDLSQMFLVIAGVFGGSLIMILVTILIDVLKNKEYGYAVIAVGIFAGVFATLLQFVLFLTGKFSFGGRAVAIALLIILLTAVVDTYQKMKKHEMEKQIAVAQGKAESTFLANMSHEIRTPINAVLGMNELILRESKEEGIREYASNIDNSGKMLLSIVNDILDFSKIRSGKMDIISDKYSLNGLVENVCEMIGARASAKDLKFSVDMPGNIPNDLVGDEVRIKQVLINLLTNSVKYTERGSITLEVRAVPSTEENILLHFTVRDTGKGIKEEDIPALFDAFSRADEKNNRNIEGTGLGLALVKKLVDAMHGTVDVTSTYGRGSAFTVEIPQEKTGTRTVEEAEKEKKPVALKSTEGPAFTAPTAEILVVDDTKLNLTVAKGLLKRTKVQVTLAGSGKDAIDLLKEKKFDVILLDHLMPVMDGEETLKEIKKQNLAPDTVIIALTANALEGAREQYLNMGFDNYLSKPIQCDQMEEMLKSYIPKEKIEG